MLVPRVKPGHLPRQTRGSTIRIGGSAYGVAAEITDPTGVVWTTLSAMDGTRTRDHVLEAAAASHPDITADQLSDVISQLEQSGYVEDLAGDDTSLLTTDEKERYSRARSYYRWLDLVPRESTWEPQLRLKNARVCLIGLGGAGGAAAAALVASGVGTFHCIGRDVVELSNLNRQTLYSENDIGRPKVEAAVERLRGLNSAISVSGDTHEIRSSAPIAELASTYDLVVLCADRPPQIRSWTNEACLSAGTTWIDTGYHGPVATAATAALYTPGSGACWECIRASIDEQDADVYMRQQDRTARITYADNAVGAASAGIAGMLASHIAIAAITGVPPVASGRVYTFNLMKLGHRLVIEHPRRADCPACGDTVPVGRVRGAR